jgi:predicted site-specific integrase-resolvase
MILCLIIAFFKSRLIESKCKVKAKGKYLKIVLERKGRKIMYMSIGKAATMIVCSYQDRLTRIGTKPLETICSLFSTQIVIIHQDKQEL